MKRNYTFITDFSRRFRGHSFAATVFGCLFIIMVLFPACNRKMSLEEAKQVTVSMKEESFVPPPRRIDDIMAILESQNQFAHIVGARIKSRAEALPPDTDNRIILAKFYKDRSKRAWVLGRYSQSLEDSRKALHYAEKKRGQKLPGISLRDYSELLELLGLCEFTNGNFRNGIIYRKRNLDLKPSPVKYRHLAWSYITIGDFNAAEKATQAGLHFFDQKMRKSLPSRKFAFISHWGCLLTLPQRKIFGPHSFWVCEEWLTP
jgi:tetratricopeptide (TPR) repeat protein